MVERRFLLAAVCAGLVLLGAGAARADYEAGQRAWDAGRHAEAVTQWRAAARADDSRAMLGLGRAHIWGLGARQDYVEAYKWLDLAAGRGNATAAARRDALAIEMTARERAEARRLAGAWRPTGKPAAEKAAKKKPTAAPKPAKRKPASERPAAKRKPAKRKPAPVRKAAKRKPISAQKAAKPKPAAGKQARQTAEQKRLDLLWPAGKEFQDCDFCPQMVVVPAGSFTMGGESAAPRHRVTIPRRFAVSKYEITFAEWDACVNAGGCRGHRAGDRNWGRGRRPAIFVNWRDARAYVEWLRKFLGQPYRLLSEAEWEYAARAGTQTAYPWGAAAGRERANCRGCGGHWDGRKTASAGSHPANAFGLHDMNGNVREWVQDCWHASYRGAPADGSARTAGVDCRKRVRRGGSWRDIPWDIRSASRQSAGWKDRNSKTGFRIALTLEP